MPGKYNLFKFFIFLSCLLTGSPHLFSEVSFLSDFEICHLKDNHNQVCIPIEVPSKHALGYINYPILITGQNLQNKHYKDKTLVISNPHLDSITVSYIKNGLISHTIKLGDHMPYRSRILDISAFAIPLTKNESDKITLKIVNSSKMLLPIELHDQKSLIQKVKKEYQGNGLFYGIIFFVFLYALLFFDFLRHKWALTYAFYTCSFLIYLMIQDGFLFESIFSLYPGIQDYGMLLLPAICSFFSLIFVSDYLQTALKFPHLNIANQASSLLSLLFPIILLFCPEYFHFKYLTFIILLSSILRLLNSSYGPFLKLKYSGSFLISSFLMLAAIIIHLLYSNAYLPHFFVNDYLFKYVFILECILISKTISKISKEVDKEKVQAIKNLERLSEFKKIENYIFKSAQFIAHDIKRPLIYTKNIFEILTRKKNFKSIQDFIKKSEAPLKRYEQEVENTLMNITLASEAPHKLECKLIPLKTLCENLIQDLIPVSALKKISFNIFIPEETTVLADKYQLKRVIENIAHNAIESIEEEGDIFFKYEVFEKKPALIISNSGSTIHEDDLDKIFEINVSKKKVKSSGLGLAICKLICKENSWSLGVALKYNRVNFQLSF